MVIQLTSNRVYERLNSGGILHYRRKAIRACLPEEPMLSIRLLGEMEITRWGERVELPPSRKTRGLLAYLVLANRPLRRDRLCALLWDAPDDPKGALRWSLSKLRSLVNDPDQVRILATRELVTFEPKGAHIDLVSVKTRLEGGTAEVDSQALKDLEAEFRGDFLEGLELSNCPDFEIWRIAVREEARMLHRRLLSALIERHADDAATAIRYARTAVGLDPDDVAPHALLLRLLIESGLKDAAEEQYAVSLRQLKDHDVPSEPLTAVWHEVRRRGSSGGTEASAGGNEPVVSGPG